MSRFPVTYVTSWHEIAIFWHGCCSGNYDFDMLPGVAGAGGAVVRSTAPLWLRHLTTWSTTRRPDLTRLMWISANSPFSKKGHNSARSLQFPINVGHPHLSVALRRSGGCGSGRGRARTGLWGGPPPRLVPDEATAPWSRTGSAPRLRQPQGSSKWNGIRGGSGKTGGSRRTGGCRKMWGEKGSCSRARLAFRPPAILQIGRPLRVS